VLVFDFRPYPSLLIGNGLLDSIDELFLQSLQLLLVVVLSLLKRLGERALLGLLFADGVAQLASFALHLSFVRALLDIWVVTLLVLSRFVVHLLQPVTLGVRVWSRSGWPVDVINLCERSLCIFDGSDDFTVLVSGAAEADGHALTVEPREDTSKDCVDGTKRGESDT